MDPYYPYVIETPMYKVQFDISLQHQKKNYIPTQRNIDPQTHARHGTGISAARW